MQHVCSYCKESKPLNSFYKRSNRPKGISSQCRDCMNTKNSTRYRNLKKAAIDYKGGCCSSCGYSKYLAALEFHHLDPSKKDFSISRKRKSSLTPQIKSELDKCIILCANCHREVHSLDQAS